MTSRSGCCAPARSREKSRRSTRLILLSAAQVMHVRERPRPLLSCPFVRNMYATSKDTFPTREIARCGFLTPKRRSLQHVCPTHVNTSYSKNEKHYPRTRRNEFFKSLCVGGVPSSLPPLVCVFPFLFPSHNTGHGTGWRGALQSRSHGPEMEMLWLYQLWYVRTVRTFSLLGEKREGVSLSLAVYGLCTAAAALISNTP